MHRRQHAGSRWRTNVAVVVVVLAALASAGCGERWTPEERAEVAARYSSGRAGPSGTAGGTEGQADSPGSTGGTVRGSGADSTGQGSTSPGSPAPTVAATDDGGAGEGGAGEGEAAAASLPCSAPSDAPGVTDSQLTIGNVNTLSGPVPGLGESFAAAVRAYVEYRNSRGGVCGRGIELLQADDGLDNGRNRALFAEMEPKAFTMISGNAAGNAGGAQIVNKHRLPVVGAGVSAEMDEAATFFPVNPLDQRDVATPKYKYLVSQGANRAAVVYAGVDASAREAKRQMSLMRASGMEIVLERSVDLSTLSWDSTARAVANSDANYLFFVHADSSSASMARAVQDTGYEGLLFEEYIVAYGSNFIDLAGASGEGASSWIFALPSEDGGSVPEQALFLQWLAQVAPDASVDTFASLGWASAKTMFDTIEAIPGALSREALLAQLEATGTWESGGLIAPIQLGAKATSGCLIGMIVEGGAWRRLNPAQGFLC